MWYAYLFLILISTIDTKKWMKRYCIYKSVKSEYNSWQWHTVALHFQNIDMSKLSDEEKWRLLLHFLHDQTNLIFTAVFFYTSFCIDLNCSIFLPFLSFCNLETPSVFLNRSISSSKICLSSVFRNSQHSEPYRNRAYHRVKMTRRLWTVIGRGMHSVFVHV